MSGFRWSDSRSSSVDGTEYTIGEVRRHLRLLLFARTKHERAASIQKLIKAGRQAWTFAEAKERKDAERAAALAGVRYRAVRHGG